MLALGSEGEGVAWLQSAGGAIAGISYPPALHEQDLTLDRKAPARRSASANDTESGHLLVAATVTVVTQITLERRGAGRA